MYPPAGQPVDPAPCKLAPAAPDNQVHAAPDNQAPGALYDQEAATAPTKSGGVMA